MGTSASSNGPASGVPFIPNWLEDIEDIEILEDLNIEVEKNTEIAPQRRFQKAKVNLSGFVKKGEVSKLKDSLGSYSKKGMGGSGKFALRMMHSAIIAENIFNAFSSLINQEEKSLDELIIEYENSEQSLYSFIDSIANYICKTEGSIDENSSKDSLVLALSELFGEYDDLDIKKLTDTQIWELISSYLVYEINSRIQLDIGQCFDNGNIPLNERVKRKSEMFDYIESEVVSQVKKIREQVVEKTSIKFRNLILIIIKRTFEVFEVNQ